MGGVHGEAERERLWGRHQSVREGERTRSLAQNIVFVHVTRAWGIFLKDEHNRGVIKEESCTPSLREET